MTWARAYRLLASLTAIPALLPGTAVADWIPLTVTRSVTAEATYMGVTDGPWTFDANYVGTFDGTAEGYVDYTVPCEEDPENGCLIGSAWSFAHQLSNFVPNGAVFSGETSGSWYGPPAGSYAFDTIFHFRFRLLSTHRYEFYWQVDPGEWPSVGLTRGYIRLQDPHSLVFHELTNGTLADSGFLAPGDYILEARSWGQRDAESWVGAVFAGQFVCAPDTATTLPYQPSDLTVGSGGTATFSVGTACAGGTPTYQWRHNLVPLSNDQRISGANGPTLTIQDVSAADAGAYDVIVTCAGSSRPSRLAQLTVMTTTTGVEVEGEAVGLVSVLSLRAPTPNPFGSSTEVAYEASRPVRVTATVYNARGAKVRTLMNDVATGSGVIRWTGEISAGRRAPAGIYFIKIVGGGVTETKKIVLVP